MKAWKLAVKVARLQGRIEALEGVSQERKEAVGVALVSKDKAGQMMRDVVMLLVGSAVTGLAAGVAWAVSRGWTK